MNLLFDDIAVLETAGNPAAVDIRGIAHDSRLVRPGDLFCCVPGRDSDGHAFAPDAVARGAVGLLCEHLIPELLGAPVVQTMVAPGTVRANMARLAAAFYGHPSRALTMVGVTGTNGKTTVTHLLGGILTAAGRPTEVMGTLTGTRTTPEATDLQHALAQVRDAQVSDGTHRAVAMEVSSHALVQARVEGIHFDVAVFTNLSHDHLDFHGTMEEYFKAKSLLFHVGSALQGVVNADDPWGQRLLRRGRIPMVPVRLGDVSDIVLAAGRTRFTWRGQQVSTALTGMVNVGNALLAAETAVVLGLDPELVAPALATVAPPPGRFQVVATPGDPARRAPSDAPPFTVVVDYAHTPAGLETVLREARGLAAPGARVLVVFGCGGDRDNEKRPLMGRAASLLSDVAVVTSDNPRHEDPLAIIAAVQAGAEAGATALTVEPDRREAIARTLAVARAGDVVLIAGKGHEQYQEIGATRLPFDDVAVVQEVLAATHGSDAATGIRLPPALGPDAS